MIRTSNCKNEPASQGKRKKLAYSFIHVFHVKLSYSCNLILICDECLYELECSLLLSQFIFSNLFHIKKIYFDIFDIFFCIFKSTQCYSNFFLLGSAPAPVSSGTIGVSSASPSNPWVPCSYDKKVCRTNNSPVSLKTLLIFLILVHLSIWLSSSKRQEEWSLSMHLQGQTIEKNTKTSTNINLFP